MGIVLRELAGPHEAVQDTGLFVPVDGAQFKISQGQIPVTADLRFIDQHVGQAVHGLDPVGLFIHFGEIHVFPVMIEMAGLFPQLGFEDLRSHDHVVAALQVFFSFPFLNQITQHHALGMKDDESRSRLVIHLEEIQFPAQTAMIPLFGLLDNPEMFDELFFRGETRSVDALEHLIFLIAAPVGACHIQKLEGLDHTRRGNMRPAAQIQITTLGIETHRFDLFGQIVQQLDLVGFPLAFEQGNRLIPADFPAFERVVGCGDFAHPFFDLFEILRRKGFGIFKIVVEAVFDGRTNADLNIPEGILDGLGHDMGDTVTEDPQTLSGLNINQGDGAVGRQGIT